MKINISWILFTINLSFIAVYSKKIHPVPTSNIKNFNQDKLTQLKNDVLTTINSRKDDIEKSRLEAISDRIDHINKRHPIANLSDDEEAKSNEILDSPGKPEMKEDTEPKPLADTLKNIQEIGLNQSLINQETNIELKDEANTEAEIVNEDALEKYEEKTEKNESEAEEADALSIGEGDSHRKAEEQIIDDLKKDSEVMEDEIEEANNEEHKINLEEEESLDELQNVDQLVGRSKERGKHYEEITNSADELESDAEATVREEEADNIEKEKALEIRSAAQEKAKLEKEEKLAKEKKIEKEKKSITATGEKTKPKPVCVPSKVSKSFIKRSKH